MYLDLKQIYWWNSMKKDIAEYVAKCPNYQHVKTEHLKTGGFTQIIDVPTWKMTMSAHFIPVKSSYRGEDYARLYIDEIVYLKVSPMKEVMRFGRKGKLRPRYVGPYEILQRVGEVAYELALPVELSFIHPVFHVSMLKKCLGDPASILPVEVLGVDEDLSYKEVPVEILERQVK
ncbi:uncharacterized protein [Solanum lycopersicum]|uniref:uncharacterized protein n=1 Tax=Solanum lycopersicum TaxID=4081 RepID=UPI0037487EE0